MYTLGIAGMMMIALGMAMGVWFIVIVLQDNVTTRKVGGIRFIKVGRLSASYSMARRARPLTQAIRKRDEGLKGGEVLWGNTEYLREREANALMFERMRRAG